MPRTPQSHDVTAPLPNHPDQPNRRKAPGARVMRMLRGFARDERGSYIIVAGMVMPALVGAIGLGTEIGVLYHKQKSMQSAADSAAVSAATAYYVQSNSTGLSTQSQAIAASYGFVNGESGVSVVTNVPPTSGPNQNTPRAVEVRISQSHARIFSALWRSGPVEISARAVAVGRGGKGCVISLSPTAGGATTIQGTAQVALDGCALYDNSSSGSALTLGGSGTLSADSVSVVGGVSGASSITTSDGVWTGQAPAPDPYAEVPLPSFSSCTSNNFNAKTTTTINPGVYCGGMTINAGAVVTLNPGIYVLTQGDLAVHGGATLTGEGVTLVFTSNNGRNYASATINGGATVNISAPTTGPTAGIALYGDRSMPVGTSFKLNGGSSEVFRGAVYLPAAALTFAGGADSANGCLQLIADTVTFVGNSNLAVNCAGSGTKPIGSALAKLVE